MLMLVLFGISLLTAIALFMFGGIWYSQKVFGKVMMDSMPEGEDCSKMKLPMALEFVSCFLLSLGVSFIFGPFDWYFGLINSAILVLAIIFPLAVSNYAWSPKRSIKLSLVEYGHRALQIIISFMLVGLLNSIILPRLLSNGIF